MKVEPTCIHTATAALELLTILSSKEPNYLAQRELLHFETGIGFPIWKDDVLAAYSHLLPYCTDNQGNITNSGCNMIVELCSVMVHPNFQGQGLGKEVVAKALEKVPQFINKGYLAIAVVHISNLPSKHIFQSLGFTQQPLQPQVPSFLKAGADQKVMYVLNA